MKIFKAKTGKLIILLVITITSQMSCKKLVEVNSPSTSVNADILYSTDASAIAVLTGVFTKISQGGIRNGIMSMSFYPSLSADELNLFSGVTDIGLLAYQRNQLTSNITSGPFDFWNNYYSLVFIANSAIEGITASTTLTPSVKLRLLGEARFIRGFCYFYLVNLYGDVPLALTSNYSINSTLSRTAVSKVYEQIIEDLKYAETNLGIEYINASFKNTPDERVRPNRYAATALLARTYLYNKDYVEAESKATILIENTSVYDTVSLANTFLKNNKEAIWQIQPVDGFITNTQDARLFIFPEIGLNININPVYMSRALKNSFERNDKRNSKWVDSIEIVINPATGEKAWFNYAYKYKNNIPGSPGSEYNVVLRLGEQYLIRAEARLQQGNTTGAIADLNIIRKRADLPFTTATTSQDVLDAIIHERQVELFMEWGHRWLDLKRLEIANDVLRKVKGTNWNSNAQLYPIPQSDISRNPNLRDHQNAGY